jgi:hypothetical protein
VTIAKRPFCVGGDGGDVEVIWVKRESKYFCEEDWTGEALICPSGDLIPRFSSVETGAKTPLDARRLREQLEIDVAFAGYTRPRK